MESPFGSKMPLEVAFTFLTQVMEEPSEAKICTMTMSIAADRIDEELEACRTPSAKLKVAKSHPEFLRAGIQFLTRMYPSVEDREEMIMKLSVCNCTLDTEHLHTPSRLRPDGRTGAYSFILILDVINTVSNCIAINLDALTPFRFFKPPETGMTPLKWPQGPQDLLPYNLDDSITSLEFWAKYGQPHTGTGFGVFEVAAALTSFYAPFATELLDRDGGYGLVVDASLEHLERAINFYDGQREHYSIGPSPCDELGAMTSFFKNPVKVIFRFFKALGAYDQLKFCPRFKNSRETMSPLLDRLDTILSSYPPEWDEVRYMIVFMKHHVCQDSDIFALTPLTTDFSDTRPIVPSRVKLARYLPEILSLRGKGCQNSGCRNLISDTPPLVCVGCDLMRFCDTKVCRNFF